MQVTEPLTYYEKYKFFLNSLGIDDDKKLFYILLTGIFTYSTYLMYSLGYSFVYGFYFGAQAKYEGIYNMLTNPIPFNFYSILLVGLFLVSCTIYLGFIIYTFWKQKQYPFSVILFITIHIFITIFFTGLNNDEILNNALTLLYIWLMPFALLILLSLLYVAVNRFLIFLASILLYFYINLFLEMTNHIALLKIIHIIFEPLGLFLLPISLFIFLNFLLRKNKYIAKLIFLWMFLYLVVILANKFIIKFLFSIPTSNGMYILLTCSLTLLLSKIIFKIFPKFPYYAEFLINFGVHVFNKKTPQTPEENKFIKKNYLVIATIFLIVSVFLILTTFIPKLATDTGSYISDALQKNNSIKLPIQEILVDQSETPIIGHVVAEKNGILYVSSQSKQLIIIKDDTYLIRPKELKENQEEQ